MSDGNHRNLVKTRASVAALLASRTACGCALLGGVACTEFKPGSDIETETGALTGAMPNTANLPSGPWACVDTPPPAPPARSTVSYTLTVIDTVTNAPPRGLSVRACDDLDTTCARPVAPPTGVSADGRVRISLARGFDGYFDIRSENTLSTRLYPDGILQDDQDGATLDLIDPESLMGLVGALGIELEPDTGIVLARGFNCNAQLSAGIEFASAAGGESFSFMDGLPIPSATTGGEGLVAFANVPRGFTQLSGTVAATRKLMGSATAESVPGAIVYSDVRPPPP